MAKKIIELLADIDVDMIECLIRLSQRKLIKSDLPSAKAKDLKQFTNYCIGTWITKSKHKMQKVAPYNVMGLCYYITARFMQQFVNTSSTQTVQSNSEPKRYIVLCDTPASSTIFHYHIYKLYNSMYDFVMDFTRFLSKEQFITILTWHSHD